MTTPTPGGLLHIEEVMGTVVTLDLRDTGLLAGQLDRAVRAAVATLHDTDRTFSTWDPDSALLRARRGQPVTGCEQADLDTVARACRTARAFTGGWFDPWAMPGGYDPTGLVKGWAARQALAALTAAGVRHAAVNAGGDLSVVGDAHTAPGADRGWRVGIVDPHHPPALLGSVLARDSAVATSAGYERGSLAVDPVTGHVVERLASATVVAVDLALADACAGAACAQGPAALAWLDRLPDVQAMLVTLDGRQLTTLGWAEATRWVPAAAPPPLEQVSRQGPRGEAHGAHPLPRHRVSARRRTRPRRQPASTAVSRTFLPALMAVVPTAAACGSATPTGPAGDGSFRPHAAANGPVAWGSETGCRAVVVAAGDIVNDLLTADRTGTVAAAQPPDQVLVLGDNQYDRGALRRLPQPVRPHRLGRLEPITNPVPGNHEYGTPGGAGYFAYFDTPPPYCAYDAGCGWRGYALNSEIDLTAQTEWLRGDLAAHPDAAVLASWHKPRWSSGSRHGSDPDCNRSGTRSTAAPASS